MISANVFNIQRFCVNDGPGIRTTVFLKGCGLNCLWCHNPESKCFERELMYADDLCVFCKGCESVCPNGVHVFSAEKHEINREICTFCGKCCDICPSEALEIAGKSMTSAEVLETVLKDKEFYDNSGGGLTISGGEPLHRYEFTYELLKTAKEKGIHTCIETSGYCENEKILDIAQYVDLFLYDWKITDDRLHKEYVGVSNERIRENLINLDKIGKAVVLRCPIIPGVNDTDAHFEGIAKLANSLENIREINIQPYHSFGLSKNVRLGKCEDKAFDTPEASAVDVWIEFISSRTGVAVKK